MIDHVRTLLINPSSVAGYRQVTDTPADGTMSIFGVYGDDVAADGTRVDSLLPLAMAPDLSTLRRFFDGRTTPVAAKSIYNTATSALSTSGLYDAVFGDSGWITVTTLFQSPDTAVSAVLGDFLVAAMSGDAPYSLGAILLACAYRRFILQ